MSLFAQNIPLCLGHGSSFAANRLNTININTNASMQWCRNIIVYFSYSITSGSLRALCVHSTRRILASTSSPRQRRLPMLTVAIVVWPTSPLLGTRCCCWIDAAAASVDLADWGFGLVLSMLLLEAEVTTLVVLVMWWWEFWAQNLSRTVRELIHSIILCATKTRPGVLSC